MAYFRLQSHFWSGVFTAGQVSDPCVPFRLCDDLPFDWFDTFLLDFFIDVNVYYQFEADIVAQIGDLFSPLIVPDSTPDCGLLGLLDADCWRGLGFDASSIWEPEVDIELFVDPDNYFADPKIRDICCVELWRCTDDLGGSPGEICSDPSALMFIQHLPSGLGAVGFSNVDPHDAFDANFERLMFCGACGEDDGLLEVIPVSL